ncbi:MAG: TonB family protein, partial [Reyranella sp.]|nr:TonB family protein [Reyranella sp.]
GAQQPSPPQPNASSTEAAKPEPDKTETPKTETPKADPPKVEQRQALATPPPPPPPPAPELEKALPPLEAPPPPVTSNEIPRPVPPPPAPKPPPPPVQHAQPAPPPPPRPPQQQGLQSSPLSHLPPPRTNEQQQAARQAPAFVNPADMVGTKRAEDQYLWGVSNKLSQHAQFVRNVTTEQGSVVLRLVIARDGHLVDVSINRSSGVPTLDNVSVNMVRQAGPYQPLPDSLAGATHVFILPLYFKRNE